MNRRGFLSAILAAGIAPAYVKAGSLMKGTGIWVPPTPTDWIICELEAQGNEITVITTMINGGKGGGLAFLKSEYYIKGKQVATWVRPEE